MVRHDLPDWADDLGEVATGHGVVRVVRVNRDLPGLTSTTFAYAAVVVDRDPSYFGPTVAMIVTVHDPDADPAQTVNVLETASQTKPGHWRGESRQVDNVYADPHFRGGHRGETSAPVAVGRLLGKAGCLTRHSATRSPDGDRWAAAVGGDIPPLLERLTGDFERHMRGWLAGLNADVGEQK